MPYAVESALYQWEEGERRLAEDRSADRRVLEGTMDAVFGELRRRLGSSFSVKELAELYGADTDWAQEIARSRVPGPAIAVVVDAAFARYARGATDFAGGRRFG